MQIILESQPGGLAFSPNIPRQEAGEPGVLLDRRLKMNGFTGQLQLRQEDNPVWSPRPRVL